MLALALATATQLLLETPAGSLPDTSAVAPVQQVLELELDPARPSWNGSLRAKLDVRRETRRFWLRLAGATPSRVEMAADSGAVALAFGWHGRDTLLVETVAPLAPGRAALNVAFVGALGDTGRGVRRPDPRHVVLESGGGDAIPAWPAGTPETPWRVSVHVPAAFEVTSNLPRATRSLQRDWSTWEFVATAPLAVDTLRLEVRPLTPRPVPPKRSGATRHRRSRRR